jgi:hypothetical protein
MGLVEEGIGLQLLRIELAAVLAAIRARIMASQSRNPIRWF